MSATDIRYGRRGGRLVRLSKAEQDAQFAAAVAQGTILRTRCAFCGQVWWCSLAEPCLCGAPCVAAPKAAT